MAVSQHLKQVKLAAKREFRLVDGVEGVGIRGDSTLIVYVRDQLVARKIPRDFMGVSIETIVTGVIIAGATGDMMDRQMNERPTQTHRMDELVQEAIEIMYNHDGQLVTDDYELLAEGSTVTVRDRRSGLLVAYSGMRADFSQSVAEFVSDYVVRPGLSRK